MKLFKTSRPCKYNINTRNKGNGTGFNPNFRLERTRFPNPTPQDVLTRMVITKHPSHPELQVGDVLQGTRKEFHLLFGDESLLVNRYCSSAVPTTQAVGIEIDVTSSKVIFIDSSKNLEDEDEEKGTPYMYRGIHMQVKVVVNGVEFNSIKEAKDAIDLSKKLLKAA